MSIPKRIFVCPLDWGIGHASRCVPLIKLLTDRGAEVLPIATGRAASFLKSEFPGIEVLDIGGYNIRYPKSGNMAMSMLRQAPSLMWAIRKEHQELKKLIKKYKADAVISDNRFGMWSDDIPSIYITHQVMVKAAKTFLSTEKMLYTFHQKYIRQYSECWIPDVEGEQNLSGDLAHLHQAKVPAYFIGPQSRFSLSAKSHHEKKYDLMVIISGPEPQRSIFEKKVLIQLRETEYKALVVLGKPELSKGLDQRDNIDVYNHLDSDAMQEGMLSSTLVICRPGYSSIMDLAVLGQRAAFVPTPGQTEQEYLAQYHMDKRHYYSVSQKDFDLSKLLSASRNYTGISIEADNSILLSRIDKLLDRL